MPFKMGFMSDTSTDIKTFNKLIRVNTPEDPQFEGMRGGRGNYLSTIQSHKSDIELEWDHVLKDELGDFREVMGNRTEPHKIFIDHPADNTQEQMFQISTTPSENNVYSTSSNDADLDAATGAAGGNEIGAFAYSDINSFSGPAVVQTSALDYVYFFFRIDVDPFIQAFSIDDLERVTLGFANIRFHDNVAGGQDLGYKIDVLNVNDDKFIEVERSGVNATNSLNQFASARPVSGWKNWDEVLNVNNLVLFRMRNLQAKPAGFTSFRGFVDYAKGFINGYGVVWDNRDNFTYRDTFTGAGFTGTTVFHEL